jgi:acetylornithine deacetylase/succinyl-diaminopimelate desuccinylase
MISGGTRENIIPEECRFSVDRRILDGEDEYTVAAEYQAIIDQLRIRKSSAAAFESEDQAVAPTTSRSKGAVAASAAALSGSESEDQTAAAPMHGAAAGGFPEISFHIRPPYYAALTDREEGFVREVRSILRDMRVQDEPQVFPGHTDAEWVINDMGIPCVIFGPGSLSTAHTAREYVPVEDLGICAELYYRVMRK